jgi:hypothetical protein
VQMNLRPARLRIFSVLPIDDQDLHESVNRTGYRLLELVTGYENPRDAHLAQRDIPRVLITCNQFQ